MGLWEELGSGQSNVTYLPAPRTTTTNVVNTSSVSGTTVEYYTRQIAQLQQELNTLKVQQNPTMQANMQQELAQLQTTLQDIQTRYQQREGENAAQAETIDRQAVENRDLKTTNSLLKETLEKCKHVFDSLIEKSQHHAISQDELHAELAGADIDFNQIEI